LADKKLLFIDVLKNIKRKCVPHLSPEKTFHHYLPLNPAGKAKAKSKRLAKSDKCVDKQ
jgi:hypothetical protein